MDQCPCNYNQQRVVVLVNYLFDIVYCGLYGKDAKRKRIVFSNQMSYMEQFTQELNVYGAPQGMQSPLQEPALSVYCALVANIQCVLGDIINPKALFNLIETHSYYTVMCDMDDLHSSVAEIRNPCYRHKVAQRCVIIANEALTLANTPQWS